MDLTRTTFLSLFVGLALAVGGCSGESGPEDSTPVEEHDRDGGEHGDDGEESGTELALDATYDRVRNGAHLVLAYSAEKNAFVGTVANATDEVLKRVRVEVHLSNGRELGPTKPVDLDPGQKVDVMLQAESTGFTDWTTHPEVGSGEHGGEHDGEHDGEHGREHRGEHDREGRGEHGGEHR